MLVLTCKFGERVVLSDGTVITVVDTRKNRVRLGFDAPAEVRIAREKTLNVNHAFGPRVAKTA